MKNSNLFKNIFFIAMAAMLFIAAVVLFATSIEPVAYDAAWNYVAFDDPSAIGYDISFNKDYVAMSVVAGFILAYTIFDVIATKKNLSKKFAYYGLIGAASVVICGYGLAVFFKSILKNGDYLAVQSYLYFGLVGLAMIGYLVFRYLSENKKTN